MNGTAGFYGEDLAQIHGAAFEGLAEAAARELIARLSPRADGRVLDLGCGAGALSLALSTAGFDVWGADVSPACLDLARRRVPKASFTLGSVFELALPEARAACAVGEVVNYAATPDDAPERLETLFARVHAALEPGGLFLFDAAAPGRAAGRTRAFTEGEDWAVGAQSDEDAAGVLTRRITTFRRQADDAWRRTQEVHRLRLWPLQTVLSGLDRVGFDGRRLEGGYDGVPTPPHLHVFSAVKRRT